MQCPGDLPFTNITPPCPLVPGCAKCSGCKGRAQGSGAGLSPVTKVLQPKQPRQEEGPCLRSVPPKSSWGGREGPHGAAREEAGTSPSLLKMQHRDAQ